MAWRFLDSEALRSYTAHVSGISDDLPAVEYYLSWDDGPFDREALMASAIPPASGLRGLVDRARLDLERKKAVALWRAHAVARQGRFAQARDMVRETASYGPLDSYQRYLLELEFDCLVEGLRLPPEPQ